MVSTRNLLWACWEALWVGVLTACPNAAARTRPDKKPWTCSWKSSFSALFSLATFRGLFAPSHRPLAALKWLKGAGRCHSAKAQSFLCLFGKSVSQAANLAQCWSTTYATASKFPLAMLFSLVILFFIAVHWVQLYQVRLEQCLSKHPIVWAWSMQELEERDHISLCWGRDWSQVALLESSVLAF